MRQKKIASHHFGVWYVTLLPNCQQKPTNVITAVMAAGLLIHRANGKHEGAGIPKEVPAVQVHIKITNN